MIRAVVFDLDDTLYPEREYTFSGFDAVARAFSGFLGDPGVSATRMRQLFDTADRPRVFNIMLRERARAEDASTIHSMVDCFRRHCPTITLHPDAGAALDRLMVRYKLGLITDGPAVQQWAKIDALNLRARFHHIIVTSEYALPDGAQGGGAHFGKPHPLAYKQMSDRLNVGPAECAYIADNPAKDFIAPNGLGWLTMQIRRTGGVYEQVQPANGGIPHRVIYSLDQLDGFLA